MEPSASSSAALPRTPEAMWTHRLDAIEQKLDRLTASLAPLTDTAVALPDVAAAATDVFDEQARLLQARGVDPEQRMLTLLALLERLTGDATVRALDALLDRADRLEPLLDLLDQAPGFIAMLADVADDYAARFQAEGLDLEQGLTRGARAAVEFGAFMGPDQLASLKALLDSGVLDPRALGVVGMAGQALVACRTPERCAAEPAHIGPLGLVRALRDLGVQRALGFLIEFGRQFGETLEQNPPPASD